MRLAGLILTLSAALVAQPPDGRSVHELLTSNDPANIAWGAELAARSGGKDVVPDLLALLRSADERVQEQSLDALIRLKAKVPPEELTPLLPRFEDAVIILAIENGQRDLLLSMLGEDQAFDPYWVAINEALATRGGGAEYWTAMLREWTIHVVIYVIDPGRKAAIQQPPLRHWCGNSIAQNRTGFPPRAAYALSLSSQPASGPLGDTVLISSPHAVYVQRRSSLSGCGAPIDRDDYRADFVASLIHQTTTHQTTPISGHMNFEVAWGSDEAYVAETDRLRENTLSGFQAILDSMLKAKSLATEDARLKPHIILGIEDQRPYKARDLPPIPPWE
jgi:hypothetical protein